MAGNGWRAPTSPNPANKMYLQSERLILRNFVESDLEPFLSYRNDPMVAKYQGWGIPYSRDKGQAFILSMLGKVDLKQDSWIQFAVALKDSNQLVGDLGCYIKKDDERQARIGFTLDSKHWRKGYITEIIPHLLDYLFEEMNIHRVAADCDVENIASQRTLEKLGFRKEAHFIESYLVDGLYASEYFYGMLQREWQHKESG